MLFNEISVKELKLSANCGRIEDVYKKFPFSLYYKVIFVLSVMSKNNERKTLKQEIQLQVDTLLSFLEDFNTKIIKLEVEYIKIYDSNQDKTMSVFKNFNCGDVLFKIEDVTNAIPVSELNLIKEKATESYYQSFKKLIHLTKKLLLLGNSGAFNKGIIPTNQDLFDKYKKSLNEELKMLEFIIYCDMDELIKIKRTVTIIGDISKLINNFELQLQTNSRVFEI
jgi:hypothetical protein